MHGGECPRCSLLDKFVRELINKARLVGRVHQFNDGSYLIGRLPQRGETNDRDWVWKKGKISDLEESIREIGGPLGRMRK
jgi:hypothetical protein